MTWKVLIADNDLLLCALLREALEGAGYQVSIATDGLEAWQKIQAESPDYLVLDLIMPKLDGARLCRHLKADPRLRFLPVIILTGMAVEAAQQLEALGAEAYIAKRSVEPMVQDLLFTLQALEYGDRIGLAGRIRGLDECRPRQIVVELLAQTDHLTAILQELGEGILVLDPARRLLYVNPAGVEILQQSERELLGAELLTILGAQAGDPLEQALQDLASQGGLATMRLLYSYRERTLQITLTNLLEGGHVAGHLLLIRDITEFFRRIHELTALNELAGLFTSTLQLDEVLRRVMERIQALMQVEACSLLLKDPEKDELIFRIALGEYKEEVQGRRVKVGEGIAGWVFQEGEAVIVPHVQQDPRFCQGVDGATGFMSRSMLCVPLKTRDKVIGVVQVLNRLANPPFSGKVLSLLSAIAAHAATAIENAVLYEELAKRNQALRDLLETSQDFCSTLELEALLQKIPLKTLEFAPAARSGLILLDEKLRYGYVKSGFADGRVLEGEAHLDLTLYPEIKKVIESRQPVIIVDAFTDPLMQSVRELIERIDLRSLLVVPLVSKGQIIGVLSVAQLGGIKRFTAEEVDLCQTLANHASVAIETARLYAQVKHHAEELERKVEDRSWELEAANARLQEALRRAEDASQHKSAFLANVSHEFRTPLNAIIGFAEVLQDGLAGSVNDKQHHYLENIRQGGHHLLNLINDLLDLSKVEAGRVELCPDTFDLRDALKAAISAIRSQAVAKGLTLELHVDEAISTITADTTRFKQILYNLLSNAVKFTPAGGSVTLAARVQCPTSEVQSHGEADVGPRTSDAKTFVEISVRDTGIGIKAEDLPKLFQPFTQLEVSVARRHEGTGLGLALTRKLVALHGGEIRAESAGEGKGSIFTVTLPLRPPGREQPRLLLVDDDMGLVEMLATVLRQAGYTVEVATNGTEALAMMETKPPDLFLLDLHLPGCDGRDILAALRAREATQRLPVIVFTGMEGISEAEIRKLGAQEFLTKPFSSTVLLQIVARLLGPER